MDRSATEKVAVTLDQSVFPLEFGTVSDKFRDLDLRKQEDRDTFKEGLKAWGFERELSKYDSAGALISVSAKHGVPFWSLMWVCLHHPTPMDLVAVLNAHYLYTCSTGVYQVGLSVCLGLRHDIMDDVRAPLVIAAIGLCITLFNVCLGVPNDLADGARNDIEEQKIKGRMEDSFARIQEEFEGKQRELENRLRMDCQLECVRSEENIFAGECEHKRKLDAGKIDLDQSYKEAKESKKRRAGEEIERHRNIIKEQQAAIASLAPSLQSHKDDPAAAAVEKVNAVDKQIRAVLDKWTKQIDALDVNSGSFESSMPDITSEMEKIKALQEQRSKLLQAVLLGQSEPVSDTPQVSANVLGKIHQDEAQIGI